MTNIIRFDSLDKDTNDEDEYILTYNDTVDIVCKYMTRVVYNKYGCNVDYFDTTPLIRALGNYRNYINVVKIHNIYNLYGNVDEDEYKITINIDSHIVTISNNTYNITNNFEAIELPIHKYPIYQSTENPVIVLLAVIMALCCVENEDQQFELLVVAKSIEAKIGTETYYYDNNTILLLSVYTDINLISQPDALSMVSENILTLADQEMQLNINKFSRTSMLLNTETELQKNRSLRNKYISLEKILKSLYLDDEIFEFNINNMYHFLIKRNDIYMAIIKDELTNQYQCQPFDMDIINIYNYIDITFLRIYKKLSNLIADTDDDSSDNDIEDISYIS